MPKAFDKTPSKIQYPSGCREIGEELNKDELLKRLKMLARAFQDMGQDEPNKYNQLALYLASEYYMDHPNKDVKLLVACCIADVFRIFAPEAPYSDVEQLKEIFLFLTRQLRGLEDTESPSFKRYFYLLENLAWVKSFNICIELEDNQLIFCQLYKQMFQTVSEKHSAKVVNFMLDMMVPLITEADAVSQELLDIILINILEPHKTQNRVAYNMARDLVKRAANALEPYVQIFFNNALMLGKQSDSSLGGRLFDLVYELNTIAPSVLLAVLPQLEFKLKSNDESERKAVTSLLARMFSDPNTDLAVQNKPLWMCFLGRFNDIDVDVRRTCVQSAQEFIVNHPDLVKDITEPLKQRTHDPDENVRMDVVQAIVSGAKKEFSGITQDLLDCVKERTLDKKFKIRKEALMGLGMIYKICNQKDSPKKDRESVAWIRNKVLHAYYQTSIDDRFLVERLLNISLVPYSLEPDERMKRLYHLYGNLDDHAVKALQEVFKTQNGLRNVLRSLLELHQKEPSPRVLELQQARLTTLIRNLPDSAKAQEYMKRFNKILQEDNRIRAQLTKLVSPDCSCKKAEECVREVLKKMGNSIPQNYLYGTVRTLLERVTPVMIDSTAIKALLRYIDDAVTGIGELVDEIPNAIENGMKLLLMLAHVFPGSFQSEEVYTQLIAFVKNDDDIVSDVTMEIFALIGQKLDHTFPQIYSSLLPVLQKMIKIGTPKQAKHAIRCIDTLCKNKEKIFEQIFEHLRKNMDLDSPYFLSSLVAIGHIAKICPGEFATPVKGIVSKFIVKELLMQDRGQCRKTNDSWYADHLVSSETQTKVQALKMMVHWLLGVKSNANNSAVSTLRLLHTMITHDGDLMERGKINKAEMARLRVQAGCCMLKLAQEPTYIDLFTLEQFQDMALLINDPCYQVRLHFAQKLHKGLIQLRLPLQFMSILCLAANDPLKERRAQVKNNLISNIQKRREYLKTHAAANAKIFSLLPDYVLPYVIHLMAHDPELAGPDDVKTLKNIKECLWFVMEPLITKNDNYSYSFYKRMIENIKQTKDKQNPDSDLDNYKLYAVCDLALGLVMTKTSNFVLKDFPAEPVLPARLFTQPDQSYSNTKSYLPKELMFQPSKKKVPGMSTPIAAAPLKPSAISENVANGSPAGSPEPPSEPNSAPSSPSPSTGRTRKMLNMDDDDEEEPSPESSPEVTKVAPKRGRGRPPKGSSKSDSKKTQGKITDFVTRGRKSRDSSPSTQSTPKSSPEASPRHPSSNQENKSITPRRRGRPAKSAASKTSGKRAAEEEDMPAAKKSKTMGRRAQRSQSTESEASSTRSTPRKSAAGRQHNSPKKRGRGRGSHSSEASEPNDTVMSPSSPSSKASSGSPSPKKRRPKDKEVPKKSYPIRSNLRRTGPFQNGTSDGEEGTPESITSTPSTTTPPKKRAAALARAIQEHTADEDDINVRRRNRRKR